MPAARSTKKAPAVVPVVTPTANPTAAVAADPATQAVVSTVVQPTQQPEVQASTAAPTEAKAAPEGTEKKKSKERTQLIRKLDMHISAARVRTSLSDKGINNEIRQSQEELTKCASFANLSPLTLKYLERSKPTKGDADDGGELVKLRDLVLSKNAEQLAAFAVTEKGKNDLAALVGRCSLRTGDDALYALIASINFIIQELATYGVKSLLAESKKKLKMHHLVNDGLESLPLWVFLRNLKCVLAERAAFKQQQLEASQPKPTTPAAGAVANGAVSTTGAVAVQKEEPAAPATSAPEAKDEEKKGKKPKTRTPKNPSEEYESRVHGIISEVVKKHIEKGEISSDVKSFGSHIVFELIDRYNKLIHIQTEFASMKTIKASTIASINNFLLVDGGVEYPEMEKYVNTRLAAYFEHTTEQKRLKVAKAPADGSAPAKKAPRGKKGAAAATPAAETPADAATLSAATALVAVAS